MISIDDYRLTENVTVRELKKWMNDKDDESKDKIINLIQHRFNNRYVKHIKSIDSGFLIMAVSCLMIETLESFRQGEKDTKSIGWRMFRDFFKTEQTLFPEFTEIHSDFYSNIRCGILHQAETKNAWRILRAGALLDKENKTINAKKFIVSLEKSLDNYVKTLKSNDFDSEIWGFALLKLEDICENCKSA